jgi:8-amino-7-oxononanoate synthase
MSPLLADAWPSAATVVVDGQSYRAFSGCDYLALAHEPRVLASVSLALQQHGVAANGAPTTTGKTLAHQRLEHSLARFFGSERALVTPNGAAANLAICQTLAKTHTRALLDEHAHDSLFTAARAALLPIQTYPHRDSEAALRICRAQSEPTLLLTDGVFATSGARADVARLLAELPPHAHLLVDDSHGFGVFGPQGRGTLLAGFEALGLDAQFERCSLTTSLSKSLGCAGGAVAGSAQLLSNLEASASTYRTSTPVASALCVGALTALGILCEAGGPLETLRANMTELRAGLAALGLPMPEGVAAIVGLVPGSVRASGALQRALANRHLFVPLMSYRGEPGTQFFRIAVSAAHTRTDILALLDALAEAEAATQFVLSEV